MMMKRAVEREYILVSYIPTVSFDCKEHPTYTLLISLSLSHCLAPITCSRYYGRHSYGIQQHRDHLAG